MKTCKYCNNPALESFEACFRCTGSWSKGTETIEYLSSSFPGAGNAVTLGKSNSGGPGGYIPIRPYYIELFSGMRHYFETEASARKSMYWPQ